MMPSFGKTSLARLSTCDERLQKIAHEAIKVTDFAVICGHRDEAAQAEAVAKGFSKAPWPESKHNRNPSMAMDLAPYHADRKPPIDWKDEEGFRMLATLIVGTAEAQSVKIKWGGDFKSFPDLPHFELVES